MHSGEFVARHANSNGKIFEKRFKRDDPYTIYKITEHWRQVKQLQKLHMDELNKNKSNETKTKSA